jgi:hypothetical protein
MKNMLDGGSLTHGRKRNMKINSNGMFSSIVEETLKEELGVSKEAYDDAKRFYEKIKTLLTVRSNYRYFDIDSLQVIGIKEYGKENLFDGKYIINYRIEIIFISNEEMYRKYDNSIVLDLSYYSQDDNLLHIRIPIVLKEDFNLKSENVSMDAKTSVELYNTLQHEFKHIYQKYKLSLVDKSRALLSVKEDEIYQNVTEWLYTHRNDGSDLYDIFYALYYLEPVEITANIQQLYGHLKLSKTKNDAIEAVNNSEIMRELKIYDSLLEKFKNNQIKLSDLFVLRTKLKKDKKWVINYITKGVKKLKQNIRKLIALIENEFTE